MGIETKRLTCSDGYTVHKDWKIYVLGFDYDRNVILNFLLTFFIKKNNNSKKKKSLVPTRGIGP